MNDKNQFLLNCIYLVSKCRALSLAAATQYFWLAESNIGLAIKKESAYQLMFKDYPDVVSVAQMCEMLGGISIKTGYELLKSGKVKSFLVGRSYRIPKLFILEYMGL